MAPTIPHRPSPSIARHLDAILDIGRHIESRSEPWQELDLDLEAARAIRALFDIIAWSDGQLGREECHLFDRFSATDARLAKRLETIVATEPPLDPNGLPRLLELAYAFDDAHGSHLAPILIDHLKALGEAIIVEDRNVDPRESLALFRTIDRWQRRGTAG